MPIYEPTSQNIQLLADKLKSGDLVAIPTETVYGLAASALQSDSCAKIFTAKQRPPTDPLIVHISHLDQLPQIATVPYPKTFAALAKLWPGPLTIILPKTDQIPPIVSAGGPKIGVRIPKNTSTLQLISLAGPLAAPSANRFGHISPVCARDCDEEFDDLAVLEGGSCEIGIESTVLEIVGEGKIYVFRRGAVTENEILSVVQGAEIEFRQVSASAVDVQTAPGQLLTHYAIHGCKSVFLAKKGVKMEKVSYIDGIDVNSKVGVINYGFDQIEFEKFIKGMKLQNPVIMNIIDKPEALIYASLRELERLKVQTCIIIPDESTMNGHPEGIYASIFDRVFRSCSGVCLVLDE